MLFHNFTIAFRNMWKFKSQTLISVIGLAVGFACFALATLWIVYEMSYDTFHKNAKNMYVVYRPAMFSPSGMSRGSLNPFAALLKETFPEIADAIPFSPSYPGTKYTVEGVETSARFVRADSSFLRMFDVKILQGTRDFLVHGNQEIAITQEKARQLFGDDDPIRKTVNNGYSDMTICAVVSDMSKHSNYAFDFVGAFSQSAINPTVMWMVSGGENTIIELLPGTDVEAFEKKLNTFDNGEEINHIKNSTIKPLTKIRYIDPDIKREVQFRHIIIFAISGLLVVFCSLFNFLTLFISRFRIRQKELALRVVCGASGGSLLKMLSVEFLFTLLVSVVMGCVLTQIVLDPFLTLSEISMNLPVIYRELLVYVGGIMLVSLLLFWLVLIIFQRRSLNASIRQSNKKTFRKMSVVAQLVISIGFTFCVGVILKQMYFLHHTDELGFSFKNSGSITFYDDGMRDVLVDQFKQIPEITEAIDATGIKSLLPINMGMSFVIKTWDDQPENAENLNLEQITASSTLIAFYDFRLVAGELLSDADPDSVVMLNESAVKAFGWHEPIGKLFNEKFVVKGVVKDVYYLAPTVAAKPAFFANQTPLVEYNGMKINLGGGQSTILFKYREEMWKSCKEKINAIISKEDMDLSRVKIYQAEEEYSKFLKSENALIKLLSVVSAICVLICVFGFVSLVSLTCEERRKEIAIRKINGATVGNILAIFAKEYFLILGIGAVIAFSAGYYIMQRWLEQYVKQTSIPAWIYLSIVFVMAFVIILCVGWQVYKTSVANPAEVVKSE